MVSLARIVILFGLFAQVLSVKFYVKQGELKCIGDDVRKGVPTYGKFDTTLSSAMANRDIVFQIFDSANTEVFHQNAAKVGTYTFTPALDGLALFCFNDQANKVNAAGTVERLVSITIDHGEQKKDYEAIAKKEQLEPLDVDVRLLEDQVSEIHAEALYQKQREIEMRNLNESVNARTTFLSIFAMVLLVGVSAWEVIYLKRYFTSKKLI